MLRLRKVLLCDYLYYILAFFSLIYALVLTNCFNFKSDYSLTSTSFKGIVSSYKIDGATLNIDLKGKEKLKVTYYLKNKAEKEYFENNLLLGKTLEIEGKLEIPLNNTIPNTFNYKKYLYNKGIFWILRADSIRIIPEKISLFFLIKNKVILRINSLDKSKGYVNTLILGDKLDLDNEVYQNYQKNGVSHLLAISGTHLSLFSFLILFLLKKCKINENKRYLITILFVFFYSLLTSFPASVMRAFVFFVFLSLNKIFYTEVKVLNILLLSGSLILLLNPFIIYDIGFMYSFMTSFGLIIYSDKVKNNNYFVSLFLISIIAFLYSVPISLNNFYELNFASVINNMFFVPLVSFILYPLCLLTFVFPVLDSLLYLFILLAEYVNTLCQKITIFTIIFPKMPLYLVIIYYMFLILLTKFKGFKYKIFICIILIFCKYYVYLDSRAYVYFLDVGQGDASVIITPYKKEVIVIDTGGKITYKQDEWEIKNKEYHLSDNTILFLKSLGISKIDNLILTHGDQDHLGEAINILKNFNVLSITLNNGEINNNERKIINTHQKNIFFDEYFTNLKIISLNKKIYNNENDNSLVLLIKLYNTKVLFMGDASTKVEEEIMKNFTFQTDIIKLGHHGSKTSSSLEFLKTVNAKKAIISSGRNNRYNHPSKETIETIEKLKLKSYNTQTEGSIFLKIDKNAYNIYWQKP